MSGTLKLNFYNASFERISDNMTIRLEHTVLHEISEVRLKVSNGVLTITNVDTRQGGRYLLWVNPEKYRSIFRIIRVLDDSANNEEHIVLAIDPKSVTEVRFPTFQTLSQDFVRVLSASNVENFPGMQGQALYDALEPDPIRRAGLFNLNAKMDTTIFQNGRSVFSYVDSLTRLRGDRIFARVQKELRDEVKMACLDESFHEVSGSLHTPPPQFQLLESFKSPEPYGNLQLTFFCKPATLEFLIDADIDDAGGLNHIFQVIEHKLANTDTHPYDIHQILTYHQKLDPGYELIV